MYAHALLFPQPAQKMQKPVLSCVGNNYKSHTISDPKTFLVLFIYVVR